jgi:hypothetical protein
MTDTRQSVVDAMNTAETPKAEVTATESLPETKPLEESSDTELATEESVNTQEDNSNISKHVPKARLNQVLAQKKEAEERVRIAEERLAQMEKKFEDVGKVFSPAKQEAVEPEIEPEVQERLNKIIDQRVEARLSDQSRISKINSRFEELSSKYNGTDGRPKFERNVVGKYMLENNIFNPETAYKEIHEADLDDWKIKQALNAKKGTFSEKLAGQPSDRVPAKTDKKGSTKEQLLEAINGQEW